MKAFCKAFLLGVVGSFLSAGNLQAQLTLSGQFKPRLEFRHGYRVPITDEAKAATYVSQRSRLIMDYQGKGISTKFSVQDVRVWGEQSQLADVASAAVHEAWAQLNIDEHWGVRLGRQELVNDDHRLVGNVDWIQQARSHDALMLRMTKPGLQGLFNPGLQ